MRYKFQVLSPTNQAAAKSRFIGAGKGDGFVYELDVRGGVLCRVTEGHATIKTKNVDDRTAALMARLEQIEQEKVW